MTERSLRFELSLEVNPRLVSVTRRFVEEALERAVDDPDITARLSMAAHELLENAAKYAVDRRGLLKVVVEPRNGGARAVVQLTNVTTPAHVERLKNSFAEMSSSDDAFTLYAELMKRNARDRDVSGLGLARIWAEGEMNLALETRDENVTIMASAVVDER